MTLTVVNLDGEHWSIYASIDEINRVLATDPVRSAPWAILSDSLKIRNAIAAVRRLDLLSWAGERAAGEIQLTKWPRINVKGVEDGFLPHELETATALLTGSITITPGLATIATGAATQVARRVRAGSVEVEFGGAGTSRARATEQTGPAAGLPADVLALITPFLAQSQVNFVSEGVSVGNFNPNTGDGSEFSDRNAFGLTRGW